MPPWSRRQIRGRIQRGLASAVIAGLLASTALAARAGHLHGAAHDKGATVVQIPLWADTPRLLQPSQIRVTADQPVSLLSLRAPATPTIIFVVLDLTSAVIETSEIRAGLQTALKDLQAQTWVGLFGTNDGLHVIQDPTQDHSVLQWNIQAVAPSGHPGLLDAIEPIEAIASRVQRKGKLKVAIFAITDSNIYSYRADYGNQQVNGSDTHDLSRRFQGRDLESKIQRMDRRLLQDRVPLFVLQVKTYVDPLNRVYDNGLQRFCETLGGASWFVQSRAEIQPDIRTAFQRIQDFYLAALKTPPPGQDVNLSLDVEGLSVSQLDYRHHLETTSSDY